MRLLYLSIAPLRDVQWKSCPYPALFVLVDSGKHLLAKINIFYMFTCNSDRCRVSLKFSTHTVLCVCWLLSNPMFVAESPSEVNFPSRGVWSWAILRAHLSNERLLFPIASVRSKFPMQIPRWFGHFTFHPLARIQWGVPQSLLSMLAHIMSLLGVSFSEMQYTPVA